MKICVDMGHTPTSPGASKYLDELTEDRKVGAALIAELQRRGYTVVNTTPADNIGYPVEINQRVAKANSSGAAILVSVHFNAGGGTGTEVLHYPGDANGKAIATKVSSNLAGLLGIADRGPKGRDNVGVISSTSMTAVLVEVCFVDNMVDKAAYDATTPEEIASAICDGIEGCDYEGDDMAITDSDINKIAAAVWNNGNVTKDSLTDRVYRNTSMLKALCGIGEEDTRDPKGFAQAIRDTTIGRWERSLRILKGIAGIDQEDVSTDSIKTPMHVSLSDDDIDRIADVVVAKLSESK